MNYKIVRYHRDLKPEIVKLQRHLWSPDLTLNMSYFEWKYEKNPYHEEPLIYLAMHDGKPIGMRGFFGVEWQYGRPLQRLSGIYADDMVIAPGHRGQSLMSKIMTSAFEALQTGGYDYVFNLSGGEVTLLSSLKMGWRNAGWLAPMQRASISGRLVRRAMRMSREIAGLGAPPPRRWLKHLDSAWVRTFLQRTPRISFGDQPRCTDMANLVERIANTGRVAHVRNREYFQWRFQNPLSRYRFFFWQEQHLEGYLILQEYTSEYDRRDVVNVVDWEASHLSIKARLLDAAISLLAGAPIVIWSATLGRQEIEILRKSHFCLLKSGGDPLRSPPAILLRPIKKSPAEDEWRVGDIPLLFLDSWDMRMLYSMNG
jgi:GNAT superfamily N-acetyltransferase